MMKMHEVFYCDDDDVCNSVSDVNDPQRCLTKLISSLDALYLLYRSAHWQTGGETFYADHLLFQRLYEGMSIEIDTLAERMVPLVGVESVDADMLASQVACIISSQCDASPDVIDRLIQLERAFIEHVHTCMDSIDAMGELKLGWEDFLGGLVSSHEEHIYLLERRNC